MRPTTPTARLVLAACLVAGAGCHCESSSSAGHPPELVGPRNLVPVTGDAPRITHKVVYVPIYSSLYVSDALKPVSLAATLSLRNTSERSAVIIDAVEYYDSDGKLIERYLAEPAQLGPMMTAEFFVSRFDRAGGSGANFIVRWSATEPGPDLWVEAVQQGRDGAAGISFITEGRVVETPPSRGL
jgi:hypothetical protein